MLRGRLRQSRSEIVSRQAVRSRRTTLRNVRPSTDRCGTQSPPPSPSGEGGRRPDEGTALYNKGGRTPDEGTALYNKGGRTPDEGTALYNKGGRTPLEWQNGKDMQRNLDTAHNFG